MNTDLTSNSWQTLLGKVITDPQELLALLELDQSLLAAAILASKKFPLRVPHGFVARMKKGDVNDPLLRQVLPLCDENKVTAGYTDNPVGDNKANLMPGLLHKYHGRVLLTISGACAVNCRFCFRREFAYSENNPGSKGWEKVIDYIAADNTIEEVIYSGGDPLTATDKTLAKLTTALAAIPHVQRLRIHTRLPMSSLLGLLAHACNQ
jgi:KamA family protein